MRANEQGKIAITYLSGLHVASVTSEPGEGAGKVSSLKIEPSLGSFPSE